MNLTAVTRLVGINENTLRAWERRYKAVIPQRDESGRRVYSEKNVEKLKLLWALVQEGHTIGSIANLGVTKLRALLKSSLSPLAPSLVQNAQHTVNPGKYLSNILLALKRFNLEGIHNNLQRARFEMSPKEIVVDLIMPLLKAIGETYSAGNLSVSQEHLFSSMLRDFLGSLHQSLSPYDFSARLKSKRILLATREGDLHEFHILMSAILSNVYQFQTYYLGPNLPVDDLVSCSQRLKPDFLILGLTQLPAEREVITPKKFLLKLDRLLPRSVTFCYGGVTDLAFGELSTDRRTIHLKSLAELDSLLATQFNL